jgi:hypothetical protein
MFDLYQRGFPPKYAAVRDMANKLLATRGVGQVGQKWPSDFVRHTDSVKTRFNREYGNVVGGVTGSFTEVKLYNPSFLLCSFFFLSLCLPTTKRTFRQPLLPITEVITRLFRVLLVLLE